MTLHHDHLFGEPCNSGCFHNPPLEVRVGFQYDDGGRSAAGFRGEPGDCVVRAAAILTGQPYRELYDLANEVAKRERPRGRKRSSARTGITTATMRRFYEGALGLIWTPTMFVGSGCQVHVRTDELPTGAMILNVSKHVMAYVDGVVHDIGTDAADRDGTRCVYGYWQMP